MVQLVDIGKAVAPFLTATAPGKAATPLSSATAAGKAAKRLPLATACYNQHSQF